MNFQFQKHYFTNIHTKPIQSNHRKILQNPIQFKRLPFKILKQQLARISTKPSIAKRKIFENKKGFHRLEPDDKQIGQSCTVIPWKPPGTCSTWCGTAPDWRLSTNSTTLRICTSLWHRWSTWSEKWPDGCCWSHKSPLTSGHGMEPSIWRRRRRLPLEMKKVCKCRRIFMVLLLEMLAKVRGVSVLLLKSGDLVDLRVCCEF